MVELDDGHHVGLMIGGQGIPLVFLHGIALNTRVYTRFLSRLSGYGFRVIALDAPAHGHTAALPGSTFRDGVDLTIRTMDALGIRRAVVVGHSMGGRATIELAAACPERVAVGVLLDAAGGDSFDATADHAFESLATLPIRLAGGIVDTAVDWWRCNSWRDRQLYGFALAAALGRWGGQPRSLAAVMRAVAGSSPTGELLRRARDCGVPFMVVHARNDMVVPWENAVTMARHSGGTLHSVRHAYHSWMIADPQRGADTLGTLIQAQLAQGASAPGASQPFLEPGSPAETLGAPDTTVVAG